jgi:glucose/arabinose dehydrogenase
VTSTFRTAALALFVAACGGSDGAGGDFRPDDASSQEEGAQVSEAGAEAGVARLFSIEPLPYPQAVAYDEEIDVYLVSNAGAGDLLEESGEGFLARLRPESDSVYTLAIGGRSGVTLNAPKGMAIVGETLWVADITVVRGFHKVTGAPLAAIDLAASGAVNLHSISAGPDSALYVTDAGQSRWFRAAPGRIWRVGRDSTVTIHLESRAISGVRAITFDPASGIFYLAGDGRDIMEWRPGTDAPVAAARGPGDHTGIAIMDDGRIMVTSRNPGALSVIAEGATTLLVSELGEPAAFAFDMQRGRVAIAMPETGSVEVWQVR